VFEKAAVRAAPMALLTTTGARLKIAPEHAYCVGITVSAALLMNYKVGNLHHTF
jgi:hypothetical protein